MSGQTAHKSSAQPSPGGGYRVYTRRWFVLITVALLNLSTNALWMSYPAVANVSAEYFDKDFNSVDLFGTIGLYVGIPFCLISTFIYDFYGFRTGMLFGTCVNFLGGLVRCLSTFPGLNNPDTISLETQYALNVLGQALVGVGNCLAVSVPTMVSQNWFPESERLVATGILSLSMPIGMVLGQGITPTFVSCPEDVPTMNIVWFVPALTCFLSCLVTITSSQPPSPPSRSAQLARDHQDLNLSRADLLRKYFLNLKSVFTNLKFMVLFAVMGGAVGFVNAFFTQLSQMMCSRGYDNVFSGMCGSLLLGTGVIGALVSGVVVEKFGYIEEVTKFFFGVAVLIGILITELLRESNLDVYIAISFASFGIFAFGMYPLGLELAVEVTYPVDESFSTALIFMSGQIQGGALVIGSMFMEEELNDFEKQQDICTTVPIDCDGINSINIIPGKDHTNFLMLLAGYMTSICLIFYLCYKTAFKRTEADAGEEISSDVQLESKL